MNTSRYIQAAVPCEDAVSQVKRKNVAPTFFKVLYCIDGNDHLALLKNDIAVRIFNRLQPVPEFAGQTLRCAYILKPRQSSKDSPVLQEEYFKLNFNNEGFLVSEDKDVSAASEMFSEIDLAIKEAWEPSEQERKRFIQFASERH